MTATTSPRGGSLSAMSRLATTPTTTPETVRPEPDEDLRHGDGDHDRFKHYVRKRDLERSKRTGRAVTALCGKKWIPAGDPSRYPMCPTCAELMAESFDDTL